MMIILCIYWFRYVVVKIVPQNTIAGRLSISDGLLYSSITKSVQKYYGDFGAASIRFGLKCKYCNDQTRVAIIRVKHKIHRFVNSILPMTSIVSKSQPKTTTITFYFILLCFCFVLWQLGEHTVKYQILYNGATIMQCNKFIVEYQKKFLDQQVGGIASANQRNMLVKNVMEISTVTR